MNVALLLLCRLSTKATTRGSRGNSQYFGLQSLGKKSSLATDLPISSANVREPEWKPPTPGRRKLSHISALIGGFSRGLRLRRVDVIDGLKAGIYVLFLHPGTGTGFYLSIIVLEHSPTLSTFHSARSRLLYGFYCCALYFFYDSEIANMHYSIEISSTRGRYIISSDVYGIPTNTRIYTYIYKYFRRY